MSKRLQEHHMTGAAPRRHKAHNADGVAYTFAPGEKIAAFDFVRTDLCRCSFCTALCRSVQ